MRKKLYTAMRMALLALTGVLLLAPPVQAQNENDALRFSRQWPASGPRMMGMAGAGISGVGNYGALFTNPAGLAYYEQSEVAGAFNVSQVRDDALYQVGDLSPVAGEQDDTQFGIGNAALAYRFPTARGSLVLAGAFNQANTFARTLEYTGTNRFNSITDTYLPQPGNFGVDDDGQPAFDFRIPRVAFEAGATEFFPGDFEDGEYPFLQAVTPGTTIQQQDEVIEEGRLTEASFGGAFEASKDLMLGLALNISFGEYRFTRFYNEIDINNENTPDLYSIVLENTTLAGFDQLSVEESIESDVVGVGLRGGLATNLSSALRAGFMVETPTYYTVDETFGTRITTFFDTGGDLSSGSVDGSTFTYEVRTPWRLGGGLSYNGSSLTLAADVELVDWSQLELDADDASFTAANRRIRDLETVLNTRFGAEYRFNQLSLRGGFAFQPDPRDVDIQLAGDETTDRAKTFYSAGIGYRVNPQLTLNVAWMQEQFDDQYRPYASGPVPGEVGEGGQPVETVAPFVDEEVTRNRFLIGLAYAF